MLKKFSLSPVTILASILVAMVATAMIGQSLSADRYSKAQLDAKLPNGLDSAIHWDNDLSYSNSCKSVTRIAKDKGFSIETLRSDFINQHYAGHLPASYWSWSWLSRKGYPNTTNPVMVDYGDTSIDLQINGLMFLCGDLVRPDVGTSCAGKSVASMYNDNRWVTNSNPDATPNPVGHACLQPAQTGSYTKILGITVDNSSSFKGAVGALSKNTFDKDRDNLSRYWFGDPVSFRYNLDKPITTSGTIRLTLRTQLIYNYGGTYRCTLPDKTSTFVDGPHDFGGCRIYNDSVSLQIQPRASYGLQPKANVSSDVVTQGQSYDVDGSVTNNGGTASTGTNWRITRMVFGPGVTPPTKAPGDSNNNPCQAFSGYQSGSCQTLANGKRSFPIGTRNVGVGTKDTADIGLGSKICYVTSVNTPTPLSTPAWRYSDPVCVLIGKKPTVQIHGGDLKVFGDVSALLSSKEDGKRYGSWGEYGVFANGSVTGFGSGSGLAKGTTKLAVDWETLTFANKNSDGSYGNFGQSPTELPPIASQFDTGTSSGNLPTTVNLGSLSSGTYYRTGNLSVTTSNVGSGKSIIVVASGTVTIKNDITYKGPGGGDSFTSVKQIPQVVIIAPHIAIQGSVTHVDAWLLARTDDGKGSIATCSDVSNNYTVAITSDDCNKHLTVNGPVATDHLYLRRTAGDPTKDEAAETFNLRADAYLWGFGQADVSGRAQTVYQTELPPRF